MLAQDRVKIVGVCYGHQIVGRALGAKVARSESGAWEVSVCQVAQTEKGKELFGGKDVLVSRVERVDGFWLFVFVLFCFDGRVTIWENADLVIGYGVTEHIPNA